MGRFLEILQELVDSIKDVPVLHDGLIPDNAGSPPEKFCMWRVVGDGTGAVLCYSDRDLEA
jgi:hypothetical protein